ncbi:uncharacterized protein B4U79_14221 [Dinothrombium tinctorium]|uniref:Uncharacterized protein n=1 Tax=Dinothrombium tinctorium TaxID=1965070 RepID=A0A3S4R6U3_9ACAR|nr:uncharacterized protein B4U79_04105 [Dinothrombium tinctorium]RWS12319.1 uncharacterized protein B4U79_14221 [Dinothrombium tinctorium]
MRIGHNNGVITRSEEMAYLATWFAEFSEMQKDDFFKILVNKYGGADCDDTATAAASMVNGVNGLQVNDRPPSIFKCRMKLFNEWFTNWSDEEKQDFLIRLKNIDADFMDKFYKQLDNNTGTLNTVTVAVNGSAEEQSENDVKNDA